MDPEIIVIDDSFDENTPNAAVNAAVNADVNGNGSADLPPTGSITQARQLDEAETQATAMLQQRDTSVAALLAQIEQIENRLAQTRRAYRSPLGRPSLGADNMPEGIPNTGNDSEVLRMYTYKHVYVANEHQLNSLDDSSVAETCPLCFAIYMDGDLVRRLPCFHLFHTTCADPWLTENLTCPSCRSKIVLDDN